MSWSHVLTSLDWRMMSIMNNDTSNLECYHQHLALVQRLHSVYITHEKFYSLLSPIASHLGTWLRTHDTRRRCSYASHLSLQFMYMSQFNKSWASNEFVVLAMFFVHLSPIRWLKYISACMVLGWPCHGAALATSWQNQGSHASLSIQLTTMWLHESP